MERQSSRRKIKKGLKKLKNRKATKKRDSLNDRLLLFSPFNSSRSDNDVEEELDE